MAVDFPANPNAGDEFVANGITYRFEGGAWILGFQPSPLLNYVQKSGDIMTGALQLHGDAVNPLDAVPLRMVPNVYLFNGEFPNSAILDIDVAGYKSVEFYWTGAIPAQGTPSLRMALKIDGVWYNAANQYQIMGWVLVGTTFTNNTNSAVESSVQLSRAYAAGQNNNPAGRATLFNGNAHASARVKVDAQDGNAAGNGQIDYWGFPIATAALKKEVQSVRILWSGNQMFTPGGWLQAIGNKG